MRAVPDVVAATRAPHERTLVVPRGALWALAMMGFLSAVLYLDRAAGDGSLTRQRFLGVATWLVLAAVLTRCTPLVRTQTLVVVLFATLVEYTFSPTLEVYLYRFHNVPAYVPPGHGLVYLSAWALGSSTFVRRRLRAAAALVLVATGVWAGYAWLVASRPDALGFFWWCCLAAFLLVGPSRNVYVGAAVVVTWLELLGTHLGTWAWQPHDPLLGVSIGNPPSGAAGGYGWFDLAGLLLAPHLLTLTRSRSRRRRPGAAQASGSASPEVPAGVGRRRSSWTEPEERAGASGSPSPSGTPPR